MINFKKSLFILISFISFIAHAEIIEIDSLDKIKQDFEENYNKNYPPQNLLVVIDLDKLLFKSLLPKKEKIADNKELIPIVKNFSKIPNAIYFEQLILTNGKYNKKLQESDFPNFINNISSKGTPIMAVNKGYTGNFNNIPKFEIWLADYLKQKFKIDFSNSFPKNNYIIFNNLKSFANTYPVFYKGILTSNGIDKAEIMMNFMLQTQFLPKVFIMISSNAVILNSMEAQLNSYSSSVLFIGYHYNIQDTENNNTNDTAFIKDLINQIGKIKRNNSSPKNNAKSKNPYDKN